MSTKRIPGIGTATKRDYACGAAMLTLRTEIGLSQAAMAQALGISRRAVGSWETGDSYPNVTHLKAFIGLAVAHSAFRAGHEAEEIRVLWGAARQKVLLDEQWLASLLSQSSPCLRVAAQEAAPVAALTRGHQGDWDDDAWMERSIARAGKARMS